MCGSLSDTRALVHTEQPLCTVSMVPVLLTLKPCSWFSLGTFRSNIITHVGTNDVCLSAIIRCGIICVFQNAVKKCEQSVFSAVSKWEWRLLAAGCFSNSHRLPSRCSNNKLNFQDLPETLLLSTNAERGLNLGTHHSPPLCKPHSTELCKTPNPWISPCFHSNHSGATFFRCVIVHQCFRLTSWLLYLQGEWLHFCLMII